MVTYRVKEEKLFHPEIGCYTAFGIAAFEEIGGLEELVADVSDVFLSRGEMEYIVGLCNESDLDVIHLHDVITDAIS